VEEIMNDVSTQIQTNTIRLMILFDEWKEMILKLMAMVEEMQAITVAQRVQNLELKAEILRLSGHAPGKMIRPKLRPSRSSSTTIQRQARSNHAWREAVDR
jgi:hypothetical protein